MSLEVNTVRAERAMNVDVFGVNGDVEEITLSINDFVMTGGRVDIDVTVDVFVVKRGCS